MNPTGAVSRETATYAAALLPRAIAAFSVVTGEDRAAMVGAVDQFLAAPSAARFLRTARLLAEAKRAAALATAARPMAERQFAEGIQLLRGVRGLQPEVVEQMAADLPVDPRAGRRLAALAALLGSYEELLSRVVADTEQMRRRLLPSMRRSSAARRDRPR